MKYYFDPHIHSEYSDGDFLPKEVVKQAKKSGMKGVVLCDHNTIVGSEEFLDACRDNNLDSFIGVEISTLHEGIDIHMLGYSKSFDRKLLDEGLKKTVEGGYDKRSKEMVDKIREGGLADIKFEDIKSYKAEGSIVMKYDILKAVARSKGEDEHDSKEFRYLLNRDGPGYVPYSDWAMSPLEAVELIEKSGGISIIAHPGDSVSRTDRPDEEVMDVIVDLIKKLKEKGMKGIEVRSFTQTDEQEKYFTALAKELDLITTGGSDWHGRFHYPKRLFGIMGSHEEEFKKLKSILP